MSPDVYRACLEVNHGDAVSIRMHSINDQLLRLYHKLAGVRKLSAGDGKCTLCYICYSHLRRCLKFSGMVQKSEKYLNLIGTTKLSMKLINLGKKQTLVVATLKPISVGGISERGKNKTHKTKYSRKYIKKNCKSETVKEHRFIEKETVVSQEIPNNETAEESYCYLSPTNAVNLEDILIFDKNEDKQEHVNVKVEEYVNNEDNILIEGYMNEEDNPIEDYVNIESVTFVCKNVDEHENNNKTSTKENIDEYKDEAIVEEYLDEDLIAKESSLVNMDIKVNKKTPKNHMFVQET